MKNGIDIVGDFPRQLLANQDIKRFLTVIEEFVVRCVGEIELLPELYMNPEMIPDKWVGLKLQDWGIDLKCLNLNDTQKRRLLHGVIPIVYRQKGTIPGIVNLIRFLLGIEVIVQLIDVLPENVWIMGESIMGETTEIGIDDPYSFLLIQSLVDLTDVQVANMLCIANYMRVGGTEVLLDYPNKVELIEQYWVIGHEVLGIMGTKQIGTGRFDFVYEQNYPYPGTRRATFVN